jgi:hypothetical protein
MIPLNFLSGPVQVVDEGDLAEAGLHGWRLAAIIFEEKLEPAFDMEQQINAPSYSSGVYPSLVTVTRHMLVKRPRYVMHREVSVADTIEALEVKLKEALEVKLKEASEAAQQANAALEAMRKELAVAQQMATSLRASNTILEDQNTRLTGENAQLRAEKAWTSGLLEDAQRNAADWLLVVKSIGADRVSEIVGHEVVDPAPLSPDQVPTTFDRLLQEELEG